MASFFSSRRPAADAAARPDIPNPVNEALTNLTEGVSFRSTSERLLLEEITRSLADITARILRLGNVPQPVLQAIAGRIQAETARLRNLNNSEVNIEPNTVVPGLLRDVNAALPPTGGWTPRPTKHRRKKRKTRRATF